MPFPWGEDKAMRILAFIFLSLGLAGAQAGIDPKLLLIEQKLGGFQDKDYSLAVEKTLAEFENRTGVGLRPGDLRRCGLKLSSEGGAGLATSKPLVRAITAALIRRGFAQQAITLCDTRVDGLRQAGFLPALSTQSQTFEGQPVIAWEMFSATWAKENQLRYENQVLPRPGTQAVPWGDARVSVLPKTLIDEVDFWINLPVLSDSKSLGVHGAMAAASLGNMANAERFMDNPFNASKAAVEVCAIPKLAKRNVLTILSLERYQVLGGPGFDASWCRSEKTLLSSANPVIIDFIGLQKINAGRTASGIEPIYPEPPIFDAANSGEIRLGTCRPSEITLVRLPAP
jgi:hypothetical protein